MTIFFDLDMTLIDSSVAEPYRRKPWADAFMRIPQMTMYNGIKEILELLDSSNIRYAVVTSSISPYCDKVLAHFNINPETCVCYHDTALHKPNPAPFLQVAENMGISLDKNILSFGDSHNDVIASNRAGITSCACMWGTQDSALLRESGYDYILNSPQDALALITDWLTRKQ